MSSSEDSVLLEGTVNQLFAQLLEDKPDRISYLEQQKLIPLCLEALSQVSRDKPVDPLRALAHFFDGPAETTLDVAHARVNTTNRNVLHRHELGLVITDNKPSPPIPVVSVKSLPPLPTLFSECLPGAAVQPMLDQATTRLSEANSRGLSDAEFFALFAYTYEMKCTQGTLADSLTSLTAEGLINTLLDLTATCKLPQPSEEALSLLATTEVTGQQLLSTSRGQLLEWGITERDVAKFEALQKFLLSPYAQQSEAVQMYTKVHDVMTSVETFKGNTALTPRSVSVKPLVSFLRSGLGMVPALPCNTLVYRGTSQDIPSSMYPVGKMLTWKSFSVGTTNCDLCCKIFDLHGGGGVRKGCLFVIHSRRVRDISLFSAIPEEEEVCFLPNTTLTVLSNSSSNGKNGNSMLHSLLNLPSWVTVVELLELSNDEDTTRCGLAQTAGRVVHCCHSQSHIYAIVRPHPAVHQLHMWKKTLLSQPTVSDLEGTPQGMAYSSEGSIYLLTTEELPDKKKKHVSKILLFNPDLPNGHLLHTIRSSKAKMTFLAVDDMDTNLLAVAGGQECYTFNRTNLLLIPRYNLKQRWNVGFKYIFHDSSVVISGVAVSNHAIVIQTTDPTTITLHLSSHYFTVLKIAPPAPSGVVTMQFACGKLLTYNRHQEALYITVQNSVTTKPQPPEEDEYNTASIITPEKWNFGAFVANVKSVQAHPNFPLLLLHADTLQYKKEHISVEAQQNTASVWLCHRAAPRGNIDITTRCELTPVPVWTYCGSGTVTTVAWHELQTAVFLGYEDGSIEQIDLPGFPALGDECTYSPLNYCQPRASYAGAWDTGSCKTIQQEQDEEVSSSDDEDEEAQDNKAEQPTTVAMKTGSAELCDINVDVSVDHKVSDIEALRPSLKHSKDRPPEDIIAAKCMNCPDTKTGGSQQLVFVSFVSGRVACMTLPHFKVVKVADLSRLKIVRWVPLAGGVVAGIAEAHNTTDSYSIVLDMMLATNPVPLKGSTPINSDPTTTAIIATASDLSFFMFQLAQGGIGLSPFAVFFKQQQKQAMPHDEDEHNMSLPTISIPWDSASAGEVHSGDLSTYDERSCMICSVIGFKVTGRLQVVWSVAPPHALLGGRAAPSRGPIVNIEGHDKGSNVKVKCLHNKLEFLSAGLESVKLWNYGTVGELTLLKIVDVKKVVDFCVDKGNQLLLTVQQAHKLRLWNLEGKSTSYWTKQLTTTPAVMSFNDNMQVAPGMCVITMDGIYRYWKFVKVSKTGYSVSKRDPIDLEDEVPMDPGGDIQQPDVESNVFRKPTVGLQRCVRGAARMLCICFAQNCIYAAASNSRIYVWAYPTFEPREPIFIPGERVVPCIKPRKSGNIIGLVMSDSKDEQDVCCLAYIGHVEGYTEAISIPCAGLFMDCTTDGVYAMIGGGREATFVDIHNRQKGFPKAKYDVAVGSVALTLRRAQKDVMLACIGLVDGNFAVCRAILQGGGYAPELSTLYKSTEPLHTNGVTSMWGVHVSNTHADVQLWSGGGDGEIKGWKMTISGEDGNEQCALKYERSMNVKHTAAVRSFAANQHGSLLATASEDSSIKLFNVATGEEVWHGKMGKAIHSVAFDGAGTVMAAGSSDKSVKIWDLFKEEQ